MSAPERIWLTDREIYGRGKPPEQWANPDKGALATAYILVTAHEAAVAAARAEGMREGLLKAAELPAYDSDGDPSGTFDHKVFVKIDAIRAEAALTKISHLGQEWDAEPLTEYERKVAQMREDFPNGI